MKSKYGIGVVSKNTVDACIDYVNSHDCTITLIPSRRQVDYFGGYVEKWNTKTLSEYVNSKTEKVFLKRDHGGPDQGQERDDGVISFYFDSLYFDSIHIDPWKLNQDFKVGCELTRRYLLYCYSINPSLQFEIGTEESICPFSVEQLDQLLDYLRGLLPPAIYSQITFAVIQSGTSLKENQNTGNYNVTRLMGMIDVCKKYGLFSKEHNGDYLPIEILRHKFNLGLNAVNIAPEFGQLETQVYLDEIKNSDLFDTYFDICHNSKKWEKWVDKSFDPFTNKEKLINICGHYVLSQYNFLSEIKRYLRPDINEVVKEKLTQKLDELHNNLPC